MNIFIGGIGGVGMGAIALLARDGGHHVRGSDVAHSLTTKELEKAGIMPTYAQTAESLKSANEQEPIDWYVHSAALNEDHPEVQAAHTLGIRTSKRDAFIIDFTKQNDLKLIAIAGTHGKTTTTAMMIWALQELEVPASYLLGSQVSWGSSGRYEPGSEYFIYECDEFDKNFLKFHPHLSVITSVEYDHADTYPTETDYKSAFRKFIDQSDASITWKSDAEWIRLDNPSTWVLQKAEVLPLHLNGEHNRRNGTLVAKALERLKVGEAMENRWAIESFPGARRRFEKLAENLYTDYGHTPTEIAATLQMASELSEQVVLIYQPHQNVRQHEVRFEYTDDVFKDASEVYWLPTYLSREKPELEILSPNDLTNNLTETNIKITELGDDLWEAIDLARSQGYLVLCMGAGSIDSWVRASL